MKMNGGLQPGGGISAHVTLEVQKWVSRNDFCAP